MLLGDSLAAGLAGPMGQLAGACETPFRARGEVGSHITQWTGSWLTSEVPPPAPPGWSIGADARPTDVLMSMGGNDYQHTDPDAVALAIVRFVQYVRDAGARLWWIAPPRMPIEDKIDVVGMWRLALGGPRGDGYAEPWEQYFPTAEVAYPVSADNIHPTPAGYAELAEAIWLWLWAGR